MTYGEQVKNALAEYEGKHGRADVIGLTPAMYDLLKKENEKFGMKEPACGWLTFFGVKLEVQDVSTEPVFCIGGVMHKPETPVDAAKVVAGLTCHAKSESVKGCVACPYRGNYIDCGKRLCADALKYIKDLKGGNV